MSHNPRFSLSTITNGITTTASYTLDDNLIVYGDNTYSYNDDGYLVDKTTPDGTTTYSYGTMGELQRGKGSGDNDNSSPSPQSKPTIK